MLPLGQLTPFCPNIGLQTFSEPRIGSANIFIQLTYSDPHADDDTLLLRTLLFKVFNKVDTWKAIVNSLGIPVASEFSYSSCENVLDDLRRNGRSLYSAAYIMPSGGRTGTPKHRMHLQLIRRMVEGPAFGQTPRSKILRRCLQASPYRTRP